MKKTGKVQKSYRMSKKAPKRPAAKTTTRKKK